MVQQESKIKDVIRHCLISSDSKIKFFGDVTLLFNYVANKELTSTISVGIDEEGKIILAYNPEFVEKLSYEALEYVMLHEIGHIVLNHIERYKEFENLPIPHIAHNIAADAAINSILGKPPFENGVWPPNIKDSQGKPWELNLTYEEYLNKFEIKECNNNQNTQEDDGKDSQSENQKGYSMPKVSYKKQKITLVNEHKNWKDIPKTPEYAKIRQEIKQTYERYKGDLPGELCEMIEATFKKAINWKIRVKSAINSLFKDYKWEPNYGRQNRRFPDKIGIIPGKKYKYKSKMIIFIDTSGSISTQELKDAFSYSLSLPYEKEIYMIDAEIQNSTPIRMRGINITAKIKVKRRGGTDFRPAFELAKKKKAKVVLYFTDLYGDFPDPDSIPKDMSVYWIVFGDNRKVPFGTIIPANPIGK